MAESPKGQVQSGSAGWQTLPAPLPLPTLRQLFFSFLRLGSVSFGGPGMVFYIRQLAVVEKGWLSPEEFERGVALCQALPGATAMQCAAYVGLRGRGVGGAAAAYLGFGLPAFLLMLLLSLSYRAAVNVGAAASALAGLRAIVVALVANATVTFGRSSVKSLRDGLVSGVAAALFLLGFSPFLIVLGAGLSGPIVLRDKPARARPVASEQLGSSAPRALAVVFALAAAAVAALVALDGRLGTLGLVMMKVDLFAFGGGLASVPLMLREVVDARRWLSPAVFMDGIALGQVTPGPIVITATFVGHQVAGLAGAVVSTVCVFLPSILLVVLVEPWFRRLHACVPFGAATRALVLSFVGLLASVTIQFARVAPWGIPSAIVAGLALLALLREVGVVWVVLVGGVASALVV